jgi:6-pyruvoyltetrahydropterin/6-carboxytetrahydropterin synthase
VVTCTKVFERFPFAHRAHRHDGHCKLIHGHNWSFAVTFAARETDANGFVMDFGKLKALNDKLKELFDHTFVVNESDPLRLDFERFLTLHGIANLVVVPDCSCEGIAKLVWQISNAVALKETAGRVMVRKVVVHEDNLNSATYAPVVTTA